MINIRFLKIPYLGAKPAKPQVAKVSKLLKKDIPKKLSLKVDKSLLKEQLVIANSRRGGGGDGCHRSESRRRSSGSRTTSHSSCNGSDERRSAHRSSRSRTTSRSQSSGSGARGAHALHAEKELPAYVGAKVHYHQSPETVNNRPNDKTLFSSHGNDGSSPAMFDDFIKSLYS